MDIPEIVSNLPRNTIDILYVELIANKMANDNKIKDLEKQVKSLTRKIARGK